MNPSMDIKRVQFAMKKTKSTFLMLWVCQKICFLSIHQVYNIEKCNVSMGHQAFEYLPPFVYDLENDTSAVVRIFKK